MFDGRAGFRPCCDLCGTVRNPFRLASRHLFPLCANYGGCLVAKVLVVAAPDCLRDGLAHIGYRSEGPIYEYPSLLTETVPQLQVRFVFNFSNLASLCVGIHVGSRVHPIADERMQNAGQFPAVIFKRGWVSPLFLTLLSGIVLSAFADPLELTIFHFFVPTPKASENML